MEYVVVVFVVTAAIGSLMGRVHQQIKKNSQQHRTTLCSASCVGCDASGAEGPCCAIDGEGK